MGEEKVGNDNLELGADTDCSKKGKPLNRKHKSIKAKKSLARRSPSSSSSSSASSLDQSSKNDIFCNRQNVDNTNKQNSSESEKDVNSIDKINTESDEIKKEFCVKQTDQEFKFKLRLVPLERLLASDKKTQIEKSKGLNKNTAKESSTSTSEAGKKLLPLRLNRNKKSSIIEITDSESTTDDDLIFVNPKKDLKTPASKSAATTEATKTSTKSTEKSTKDSTTSNHNNSINNSKPSSASTTTIDKQHKTWNLKRCVVRVKRVTWPAYKLQKDQEQNTKEQNTKEQNTKEHNTKEQLSKRALSPTAEESKRKQIKLHSPSPALSSASASETESMEKPTKSTSKRRTRNSSDDDSDFEVAKEEGSNKNSDSENERQQNEDAEDVLTSDSEVIPTRKKRVFNSRSSSNNNNKNKKKVSSDDDENDSEFEPSKKKKSKANNKKRRRIKTGSDAGNDDDDDDDDEDGKGKKSKKRKDIRKIIKTKDLDVSTKEAAKEEEDRRKRIEERQKLYNQIYERAEAEEINELILDFNEETKEAILQVDAGLLKKLKPHQVTGVKFMWEACFETVSDAAEKPGSGCILAHCMGLGKTLQVVTLSHTVLVNSRKTNVERVLIISPLSTLNNWAREFKYWISFARKKNIEIYDMSRFREKNLRIFKLNEWFEEGGVCILGYDMYRILANEKAKGLRKKQREDLQRSLVDPGPDLVVCDEGHLLKNEKTSISKAVNRMRTKRRIVLTGTPLQNNLKEYYCMIQFIKPNLLGTYKEYLNRFVNPITNGQYADSTDRDLRLMRHRSHILHKLLEGCIQRRDYSVLAPYLPPKQEYVVYTTLSELQQKLYDFYMTTQRDVQGTDIVGKGARLFQDFQDLRRIWTHPMSLRVNSDIVIRKRLMADDENSLDDFICDDDDDEDEEGNGRRRKGRGGSGAGGRNDSSSDESSSVSIKSFASGGGADDDNGPSVSTKQYKTRANRNGNDDDQFDDNLRQGINSQDDPSEWWKRFVSNDDLSNVFQSPKLVILMQLLQQCEVIGDKLLVFSQSLQSLDVIEHFLALIDSKTRGYEYEGNVGDFKGYWKLGVDYFRLDGSCSVENREDMCKRFNDQKNLRARLFLISTRAGGLGINLVAANRVVIFDVSWNPSHDTQSIFRVYRFGQDKPCYIYRLIAMGTMEQKVYERQVTKQATAKRVIDEQQITRHYNSSDLQELYTYELQPTTTREVPILPKDRLFAELLAERESLIFKYHEHDSLLENEDSETLNEEDRKAAWAEYEAEKTRATQTAQYISYDRSAYANPTGGSVTSNRIFGFRSDVLLHLLQKKVKNDNFSFTQTQVLQLVPEYLNRLYNEMNNGDPTMYKELLALNTELVHPSGMYMNPLLYANQNPGAAGYYQAPQQQQQPLPQPPINPNAAGFESGQIYEID